MRILVTGGAGFIGANLCRVLADSPWVSEIRALDDLSTGDARNLTGLPVALHVGSITDEQALERAATGTDAIVHLAARPSVPRSVADPVTSHVINATGTLMVLEAARRHGGLHTVVASSSSVYGANRALPKEEDMATRPLSPYGATKLATESYALAWQHSYGLPVLAFRFFNVYGPLQRADHAYAAVVPRFVDAALAGRPLTVHGDGTQSRDFTYVDTVAGVLADAVRRTVTSDEPVNLAFGTRTDLRSLIGVIQQAVGHPLVCDHTEPRTGDVPHSQADGRRLAELFPDVTAVPLEEGVRRTVAWMTRTTPEPAGSEPEATPPSPARRGLGERVG